MTVRYAYYRSPFGLIEIGCEEAVLSLRRVSSMEHEHCPTPLSDRTAEQLTAYFEGRRNSFDLPLAPQGTPFQQSVWQSLLKIPFGEVRSYGDIAAAIGNPQAARAVGMACRRNPIWILIPCHRVVGRNRALTGYAGGLDMKQALLELEQGM